MYYCVPLEDVRNANVCRGGTTAVQEAGARLRRWSGDLGGGGAHVRRIGRLGGGFLADSSSPNTCADRFTRNRPRS
jgi:hypothetical protein